MGKGSKRRTEDIKKIDENWDKIFKEKNMYKVLDACCGCKMMWFDKYNKKVLDFHLPWHSTADQKQLFYY